MSNLARSLLLAACLGALLSPALVSPALVRADHGASDERVSLPDGPGSVGGVGDNVDLDVNMGSMMYQVAVDLPQGHAEATPSVALTYSSAAGSSEVGVGWSMGVQAIERMRLRGLPEYTDDDEFAVDGGVELVRVGTNGASIVYRARFERGFVRYQWHDVGDGRAGYWTAEQPDGSISYYGADESRTTVRTARVESSTGGVYRYLLAAQVDRFGHVIRYRYLKDGEWSLLDEIAYAEQSGGGSRFAVRFAYEARGDRLQTGEPGFLLTLSQRLREIQVRSGAETIRRYVLAYESDAQSGGVSRLASVRQYGRADELSPIAFTFSYSRSLDGACEGACEGPFVVDMGTLPAGVSVRSGSATLLDIDGDALPDVLSTDSSGRHTWVPAQLDPETGRPSWGTPYESTATTGSSPFVLGTPRVQVIDVDGDGFTDIVEGSTGGVLCNDGSGDWNGRDCLMDARLPVLAQDEVGDQNPLHVRFLDYDDDKRIDILRTVAGVSEVFVNDGTAFTSRVIDDIGAVFDDSPTLQLADLNGDGLQDPVEFLSASEMRFRSNLGFGRWTEWQSVAFTGFGASDLSMLQLEDINGDGLADVTLVAGDEVRYAINRNGARFDAVVTLTSADVDGDLPARVPDSTVVLFADMNGSGSRDVVWIDGGRTRFLELFPTRPNLLSRVENGIGSVQEIEYGTSVRQLWRDHDTNPWDHRLPYPMNVVVGSDVWNRLTATDADGVHQLTAMSYRDGFYDGTDRAFRGYAHAERVEIAGSDDGDTSTLTTFDYDVGAGDRYRHGLLLRTQRFGGEPGSWSPVAEERHEYDDCALAEVPSSGLRLPVRWICGTSTRSIAQEGAPEADWITTGSDLEHDGYGNVVVSRAHGVLHHGPPESPAACGACGETPGPCGEACAGDETIVETTFVVPGAPTGGAWILSAPVRVETSGSASGPRSEVVTRYDGPDFVGLAEGRLTRGAATSVRARVDDTEWIETHRNRRDAHGNIVELLEPDGSADIADDARTLLTYDELGLRVVRVDRLYRSAGGEALTMRREYAYESAFLEPIESTDPVLVRGGTAVSARHATRYRYDAFGRVTARLFAGDSDATPTEEYAYELGSPVSRVVKRSRSVQGGAQDLEEVQCVDGLGREVQRRTRIGAGTWQVSGFRVLNRRGLPIRLYRELTSTSGACDATEPTGVPYEAYRYDASERPVETTLPDDDAHGTRSVLRVEYGPLRVDRWDASDTDADSPHAATPLVERYDGQGRIVSITRDLGDGTTATVTLSYDDLGRLAVVRSPDGVEHAQSYDLTGRVVSTEDPDRGRLGYVYDPSGNVIERVDARGARAIAEYDGLDRLVAQWDAADEDGTRVDLVYDEDPDCAACTNTAGRVARVRYPLGDLGEGIDQVGYDARGRAIMEARTLEGRRFVSEHEYDAIGRRIRSTYPGGIEIERGYDQGSRPTSIGGVIDEIAYDERGRIGTMMYANGTRTERTYGDAGQLDGIETLLGPEILQGLTLRRDRVGNVISITDVAERGDRPSASATFEYDGWYRVRRAAFGDAGAEIETLEYAYDDADRVTRLTSTLGAASRAHVGDLEYDDAHPNAVVRAGEREYAYDASGNVTTRGATTLSWDHLGRLTEASEDGTTRGRFFYGSGSARVMRLEDGGVTYYVGEELEIRDGVVHVYPRIHRWRLARLRSADVQTDVLSDVAPRTAGDGEINAADAWISRATAVGIVDGAPGADDPMRLLRGAARRLLALDGGELTYLHQDNLGSITLATDSDGATVGETLFYPSGEVRHRSGFTDEHGFTGQEEDASTGLLAFQFRYLDADVGRWASADPAFASLTGESVQRLGESTTGYAYVANRYPNAIDPLGLAAEGGGGRGQGLAHHSWVHSQLRNDRPGKVMTALNAAGRGVMNVGRAVSRSPIGRFVSSVSRAHNNFRQNHPILYAVARIALTAAIGSAIAGPAGLVGVLIATGVQAGLQGTRLAARYAIRNWPAAARGAAAVTRWWDGLGKTTGGVVLQYALSGLFMAGAFAAAAIGGPLEWVEGAIGAADVISATSGIWAGYQDEGRIESARQDQAMVRATSFAAILSNYGASPDDSE